MGIQNRPRYQKNGKIRVCIDFRDLNEACPKDGFPLPITDVMIDNTCGFEYMSFMDRFSGYNHIKMYPDEESIRLSGRHWGCIAILSCSAD